MPLSRESANIIREVEVTQARPQNHCASVTIQSTTPREAGVGERLLEDVPKRVGRGRRGGQILNSQRHERDEQIAEKAGDRHGEENAPGRADPGVACLLDRVRGGVIAGIGPLGQQEPAHERIGDRGGRTW